MFPASKPSGMFGSTVPYGDTAQEPPDKHAGLKRAAGIFADFAAGVAGRPGPYLAMEEQRRKDAQQQAQYQRQQADEYAMFVRKNEYEAAHPSPKQPGEYESALIASGIQPGTPEWTAHMGNRAASLENPVTPVSTVDANGDPAITWVPRNPTAGMHPSAAPSPGAIDHLRQNPSLRDAFEQKYGPGSAAQYLGGASAPGAPPFSVTRSRLDAITSTTESGNRDFYANGQPVTSPKGALYGMQVMPSTARDPGFGLRPADPNNPADMNRLGREYRAAMQQRYGGDPAKMWAAYNAGPGRTDRALATGPNWFGHLPPDTQKYVAQNLRALRGR